MRRKYSNMFLLLFLAAFIAPSQCLVSKSLYTDTKAALVDVSNKLDELDKIETGVPETSDEPCDDSTDCNDVIKELEAVSAEAIEIMKLRIDDDTITKLTTSTKSLGDKMESVKGFNPTQKMTVKDKNAEVTQNVDNAKLTCMKQEDILSEYVNLLIIVGVVGSVILVMLIILAGIMIAQNNNPKKTKKEEKYETNHGYESDQSVVSTIPRPHTGKQSSANPLVSQNPGTKPKPNFYGEDLQDRAENTSLDARSVQQSRGYGEAEEIKLPRPQYDGKGYSHRRFDPAVRTSRPPSMQSRQDNAVPAQKRSGYGRPYDSRVNPYPDPTSPRHSNAIPSPERGVHGRTIDPRGNPYADLTAPSRSAPRDDDPYSIEYRRDKLSKRSHF